MTPSDDSRPQVVFSLGDPNGVGPEVLLKALLTSGLEGELRPVIFGSRSYLSGLISDLGLGDSIPAHWRILGSEDFDYSPAWGKIEQRAGRAAISWLEEAVDYATHNRLRLLVTGPIHKQSVRLAGFPHPGHTEFLAERLQAPATAMAFFSPQLAVVLATVHIPLRNVPDALSPERIVLCAQLLQRALESTGKHLPRLALCGLNPHASEGGLFGNEENEILLPAIEDFNRSGGNLHGPIPGDTVFYRAVQGEFDGVVALYHDQGLLPVKLLSFHSSTNATLGLPLIRTSPDHGTAFDIAGQNQADPGSMVSSILWGLRLAGYKVRPAINS